MKYFHRNLVCRVACTVYVGFLLGIGIEMDDYLQCPLSDLTFSVILCSAEYYGSRDNDDDEWCEL